MKIIKTFDENVWLLVVAVIILIAFGALGWKWSLNMAGMNRSDDSVNALLDMDFQNNELLEDKSAIQ
ncbi:MAG: hypothetical protein KHZ16_10455 [Lachnospiraceae bacterium]|nr:hypothetical protein [Lachnospiraceae bacterium]